LIYQFHVATYQFALPYVRGQRVLDLGCGSGYGTALAAGHSQLTVGVDIAGDAIQYAIAHYSRPGLSFLQVDNVERWALPFSTGAFDVVLSFQVIEHLWQVASYLQEICRLLRPGGVLVLATPDRSSRLFPFQKPWNVWHTYEFSADELDRQLGKYFSEVQVLRMGAAQAVLQSELRRVQAMRWLTLPLTLPFIPEMLRRRGLFILKRIKARQRQHVPVPILTQGDEFDLSAIQISPGQAPSINLLAVARTPS